MHKWYMATLNKAPSLNQTVVELNTESYDEAKAIAGQWVKDNGRPASLHSNQYAVYAWYRIDPDGHGWDRNTKGLGEVRF
jgi:predicted lactoylglutathione lyase